MREQPASPIDEGFISVGYVSFVGCQASFFAFTQHLVSRWQRRVARGHWTPRAAPTQAAVRLTGVVIPAG